MFAETLLESGVARRPGRGWATTASFALQIAVLAVLVILPSLYPEMMALRHAPPVTVPLFSPAPEPVPVSTPSQAPSGSGVHETIAVRSNALTLVPAHKEDTESGPPGPPNLNLTRIGSGPYVPNVAIIGVPPPVLKPTPPSRPVVVSKMAPGDLIHRVQPTYPQIAKITHIEGTVTLTAIISRAGEIESLHVVSGNPFLAQAALDAVQRWRYRPYILNGEPVEVETQITVNFRLSN